MRNSTKLVVKLANLRWLAVVNNLRALYNGADVCPKSFHDVFSIQPSKHLGCVCIDVRPVVFRMPERASHSVPNLYIGVKGQVHVFPLADSRLVVKEFGTSVGYFRNRSTGVDRVFGVHYDLDESTRGHPAFHAQMKPQNDLFDAACGYYGLSGDGQDYVRNVLRSVRIPTAEMDVFSVFSQIVADHLIDHQSGTRALRAFDEVCRECGFLIGRASEVSRFGSLGHSHSYRGPKWY